MTPMLKQYTAIRKELPEDVLLFFRLGDFYELFMDDAKEAAGLLGVALTKRNGMSSPIARYYYVSVVSIREYNNNINTIISERVFIR